MAQESQIIRREKVAVLTTSRAEYYHLRPVLRQLRESSVLDTGLIVSGTHLSERFGQTERAIAADGWSYERVPILVDEDSGVGCAKTAGLATTGVAEALSRLKADLLLVLGDRYEVLAAALGAVCLGVPIAHIHGGERTDGALDDACRHALTKLSALHFVATAAYQARVAQMGEAPERIFNFGAPFVDSIVSTKLLSEDDLAERLGVEWRRPVALIAYHPATRESSDPAEVCQAIVEEAQQRCRTMIVTGPNSDPGYEAILRVLRQFSDGRPQVVFRESLGGELFLSAMARCEVMIGNSSSGIHEAASFGTPVVNVGTRQAGRLRPRNVIDCGNDASAIAAAIERAISPAFRDGLAGLKNPYGDGHAAERIVKCLEGFVPFRQRLGTKTFHDGPAVVQAYEMWRG